MPISMNYFWSINNSKNTTSKQEADLYEIKQAVSDGFADTIDFTTVTINSIEQDILVINISTDYNKKTIKSRPNESFKLGDVVRWDSNCWIVTEIDSDSKLYTRGKIERCNYDLKLQLADGSIATYPVIFESKIASLHEMSMLTTLEYSAILKIRFNTQISKLLVTNKRLMIDSRLPYIETPNIYKIIKSEFSTFDGSNGLLICTLNGSDFSSSNDNINLGVCDYTETVLSSDKAIITYDGKCELRVGYSKIFTALFYDSDGQLLDLTPVWSIMHSSGDNSNITTIPDNQNKTIRIICSDDISMTNTYLVLGLTDESGIRSSSINIPIVPIY